MRNGARTRVAIACQGGGSHTAFTAGVLQGLLQQLPPDVDVVALSGTSGGAICAALAWDGLVRNDPALAIQKLQGFWEANSARDPWDQIANRRCSPS
jgi:NTE family protein